MSDAWFDKYAGLRFERRDHGILLITIDRPEHKNATDAPLHNALSRVWLDVDDDPEVFGALLAAAVDRVASDGGAWLTLGLHERDPLLAPRLRERADHRLPGAGHCPMLSQPTTLAACLAAIAGGSAP